ncbi:MAG: TonB family protein, partial [Gammaproteobacteria bacterium]|nr:TonB family protein [Gammaproteobacteria bacterium]
AGHRLLPQRPSRLTAPDRPFELSLQAAQPEAPPAPLPPVPHRVEKHRRLVQPAPLPPEPVPVEEAPVTADAAFVAAPAAPPAAPTTSARPDLESLYTAQLLADIRRRNHPPDSAQYRLQQPHGEVQVRFVLLRSGEARAVTVARSSGSALLDQEAVKVVASGHYPPMPEKAFAGETQHTFLVTIEYQAAHLTRCLVAGESVAA